MRKKILLLCVSLVLALPGAALAAKDTLRVGVGVDAKNLDPHHSTDSFSFGIIKQLYEPLFTVDSRTKKLVPVLVDKWEMLDDSTYKLFLKKDVMFHNGEELTSEDVVFTLMRIHKDSIFSQSFGRYIDPDGFKIIDKHTLIVKTQGPNSEFLTSMKHPYASVMNKKAVTAAGREYFRKPVGTGAYKFKNWTKGESVDLERFDAYHGTPGNFAKMRFLVLPENASRLIALETGKVDMIYAVPFSDYDRLVRENKVKVVEAPGLLLLHMGMNTQSPRLKDPRVRLAIEYAVNKEAYNQVVYDGHGAVPRGSLPPAALWFPENAKAYPHDPAKARELLREAGVKDLKLSLCTINASDRVAGATLLQAMLAEAGIQVEIQVVENAMFDERIKKGDHDLFIATVGMQTNRSPGAYWYVLFLSNAAGFTNKAFVQDEALDKDILFATSTVDDAKRLPAYQRIFDRLNELHPFVYLSHPNEIYAGSKDLEGMDELYDGKVNYLGHLRFKK